MKKKGILAVLMVAVFLALMACESSPSYSSSSSSSSQTPRKWAGITLHGEDEPFLEGTTWIRVAPIESYDSTIEFRAGGRLVRNDSDGDTFTGTWKREGDNVTFIFGDGLFIWEGKYYPQTQKIMLTWKNSANDTGDVTLEPFQGSLRSIAQSSAQSSTSTTNVIVQPSAPAQTAPSQQTPSAPTLRTGTYAASGTNMTMSLNLGQVTAFIGRDPIAFGTYRVSGNQVVITFDSRGGTGGPGDVLKGNTYAYNITSDATFSGNGESWARTGY